MAEVKGRVVAVWRHAELPRLFWGLTFLSLSLIIARLYKEILAQGYTGTPRTLEMRLRPFRPKGAHPVSKQTVTLDKPPSARSTALMIVRPAQNRTREQTAYLAQLAQSDQIVAKAFTLAQDFGHLLRQREGLLRLEQWKTTVRASGITELIAFADGLADDAEAVANGCSMMWSNGMVEGFVNKVKAIKRSSYGQAGFPLLQRRVLLHPASRGNICSAAGNPDALQLRLDQGTTRLIRGSECN